MTDESKQIVFPLSLQSSIDDLQQQVVDLFVLNKDATNAINDLLKKMCLKVVQFIYSNCKRMNHQGEKSISVHDIHDAIVTFFPKSFAENIINPISNLNDPKRLILSVPQVHHFLQCSNFEFDQDCAVFLTFVLEFIAKEVIDSAAEAATVDEMREISLFHIYRAVWGDTAHHNVKSKSKTPSISFFNGDFKLQELAANVGWTVVVHRF